MESKQSVLVVDDDRDLRDLLELKLNNEGYRVTTAPDGEAALKKINELAPSLIILDVNMPKMNGWDVCKYLKTKDETKNIPIIMLTVKSETIDRILGLEFGAEDYLTKPFNVRELILRVKNILKRVYAKAVEKKSYRFGNLTVDLDSHEVKIGKEAIFLTTKEFKLLVCLIAKPGQVKSRDFLLEKIWEYNDKVFSRTVDTHIQRLRTKLKKAEPKIETVRGIGYRFSEID